MEICEGIFELFGTSSEEIRNEQKMKDEKIIAEKDKQISDKDRQISDKDKQISDKDKLLSDNEAMIKALMKEIEELRHKTGA